MGSPTADHSAQVRFVGDAVPRGSTHRRLLTRLALRDISRHKARAVLVVLLVALPVALVSALGVFMTMDGAAQRDQITDRLGDADFIIRPIDNWNGHCHQDDLSDATCSGNDFAPTSTALAAKQEAALAHLTLARHELVPMRQGTVTMSWRGVHINAGVTGIDLHRMRPGRVVPPSTPTPGADEVWPTAHTARQFSLTTGSTVVLNGRTYTVTGTVRTVDTWQTGFWVGPNSPLVASSAPIYYVRGAEPTHGQVADLNDQGLGVITRAAVMSGYDYEYEGQVYALSLVIGVLAALVTATVAGAAFAIGARQQRRTLALLGTTGAGRADLVGVLQRQGWLLGGIGSVLGVLLGVGAMNLGILIRNHVTIDYPNQYDVNWQYCLTALVIGILASAVACWIPAREVAGQDPLIGVRRADLPPAPARVPWLAMVLGLLGIGAAVVGPILYRRQMRIGQSAGSEYLFIPVMTGVVLLYLASLVALPWLLDRISSIRRGGLATRFALRDMGRNRARAAACVASSMAVMALFSAILVVADSTDRQSVRDYAPAFPAQTAALRTSIDTDGTIPAAVRDRQVAAVRSVMGEVRSAPEREASIKGCTRSQCDILVGEIPSARPGQQVVDSTLSADVAVDDGTLYQVLTGRPADARVRAQLASGAIVFQSARSWARTVNIVEGRYDDPEEARKHASAVKVYAAPVEAESAPVLIGREVAAKALKVAPDKVVLQDGTQWFRMSHTPSSAEATRVNAALAEITGSTDDFAWEAGPSRAGRDLVRWGTLVAAVMLGAVAALTMALTLSDSRSARASMASVGASSSTLRSMAAVQALVTTLSGHLAGVVVGAVPFALAIWASGSTMVLGVPWGWLALAALAVPVVVSLIVRLLVPATAPEVRRLH
ncbi:FtsX-like permease family protein [Acidipropionibacterium timonense]|uniref:FtsX-like permease family protein n=1 Tax=Acidipropionibacterium timonense TaxID=2161818 RepID=UPI00102F8720|nr:FtsX-like permease family protein [Acidipropionibacterium timonense]